MAVRTREVGIKNKRRVTNADEAQPNRQSQGLSNGRKTVPRDQAAALRRQKLMRKAKPGPAMTEPVGLGPATTEVRPGKKTLTRRKAKRGNIV
ncbi:hypothetical protein F0U60_49990 [Archangium minus]|uniref:Uncharacterized protein n=1 Tax=Archangium minus TaxID=83450 RepID=A0ABY9X7J9_9BACT|nr:hypothetical protein F0U61_50060 [Archangium violaceum]WNG51369.1 hypothetical protein F0U60_49990 [Archangium minus]